MTTHDTTLSLEDANRRLPLVRAIVRDAVQLKGDIIQRHDRLAELRERYPELDSDGESFSEEVLEMEETLEADEIRIDEFAGELQCVGAELVNAAAGLVEFASVLDGMPIRLSWQYDEPEIGYWRSEGDEPADRRPLIVSEQGAG